jgi:DNA-binding CsgD family transcriptional regulator
MSRVDDVKASARQRGIDRIAALARRPTDLVTLWHGSTEVLADAVPHYQAPCWYTIDPASLLITSHFHDGLPEFPAAWLASEYQDDDVLQIADVIRSESGMRTLHEAAGGDPSITARWARNMTMGGDQELVVRLRGKSGAVWGALSLYREPGRPMFNEAEKAFLLAIAPHLAEGARRALLVGEAIDPEGPDAPGLVILTDTFEVESATPCLQRWMAELPDGDWDAGRLPTAVLAVAARALESHEDTGRGGAAVSRVLSRNGVWVVLHGAALISGGSRRVAVIVEPAHPARIFPLLMSAYGLTIREQEVTRLILQGSSTTELSAELLMSVHTVQQHLKSIFGKTGVRSRRDLVTKVFFAHYEPRFRDNERRTSERKPVRGGPYEPAAHVA